MAHAGRIRLAFTDRHGIGTGLGGDVQCLGDGGRDVDAGVSSGRSPSPYGSYNLALHVGDDPQAVAARRERLGERVVFMDQVHGCSVAVVDEHSDATVAATDALVTRTPGIALAVLVADCLPVLLFEPHVEVVSCAHAGRQGIALGVLDATLKAIETFGGRAARTRAWIGPSIGPCCYEVPAAMRDEFATRIPDASAHTSWGTPSLDLRAAAVAQLRASGVSQVVVSDICTAESADHFSYRRDKVTGRFAGLIELLPATASTVADS